MGSIHKELDDIIIINCIFEVEYYSVAQDVLNFFKILIFNSHLGQECLENCRILYTGFNSLIGPDNRHLYLTVQL